MDEDSRLCGTAGGQLDGRDGRLKSHQQGMLFLQGCQDELADVGGPYDQLLQRQQVSAHEKR